jgi:hypothetical protein
MGQHIIEATFTVNKRSKDSLIVLTRELWEVGLYVRDNPHVESITVCGPAGLIGAAERICQKYASVDDYTDEVIDDVPDEPDVPPPPISSTSHTPDLGSDS